MPFGFMSRIRNGYGNIYTPHAGSMIIQVQRETGLANRTIVLSERQVRVLRRMLGSRFGILAVAVFLGTWLLFAIQSVRVPLLSGRIAQLERDNQRIDSLQIALARMSRRYEQVNQMLRTVGAAPATAASDSASSVASIADTLSAGATPVNRAAPKAAARTESAATNQRDTTSTTGRDTVGQKVPLN